LKPQCPATYTAIGFVQALMGKLEEAVESFHKSLALKRDDAVTTTILKYVIEDLMEEIDVTDLFNDDNMAKANTDVGMKDTTTDTPIKLNCMKLKFDDYDSNVSQNSDTVDTSFDMSMDV
jgi:anaphase-promoting complex subunit 6